jgi:hypothetical protein
MIAENEGIMWHRRDFEHDAWRFDGDDASARLPRDRFARDRADRTATTTTDGSTLGQYVSGDPNVANAYEYNIQIKFVGSWTDDLRQAFVLSAEAISDFIVGDIPNVGTRRSVIDDILITASLASIDGGGGILAQAGPDFVRPGSYLPWQGTMQFDAADAGYYNGIGIFDDIVLHEMIHTIGFGTIWTNLGLISGGNFAGSRANATDSRSGLIPLELDGGAGTSYSHWDEETFGTELMTGFIDNDNYLSYMTIASLGDLGYNVVSGASYTPPWFV